MLLDCLRFENPVIMNSHTDCETLLGSCQNGAGTKNGVEWMVAVLTLSHRELFWRYSVLVELL